jgi:hypothetical protein
MNLLNLCQPMTILAFLALMSFNPSISAEIQTEENQLVASVEGEEFEDEDEDEELDTEEEIREMSRLASLDDDEINSSKLLTEEYTYQEDIDDDSQDEDAPYDED